MFLRPTPPRLTRRSRLEHLLLLLLRCAVICLLAAGLCAALSSSRPCPSARAPAPAKRIVVLVDTSASMRAGEPLGRGARQGRGGAAPGRRRRTRWRCSPSTGRLTPLVTFEQWTATAAGERVALARSAWPTSRPAGPPRTWTRR